MTIRVSDIIERFPELLRLVHGDAQTEISRPRPPSDPASGCILFLNKRELIADAVGTSASALVVADADVEAEELANASQTVLQTASPELAMALVARAFFPVTADRNGFDGVRIHPSAVISESASVAEDAIVGPNAVIGENARIGVACVVGANATIESDVDVGEGTHIHANVFIAHGTVIGKHCEIHPMTSLGTEGFGYAHDKQFNHYRLVHYGRLVIEDDVHVGSCVTIDRGVFADSVIGRGTKIDNHIHMGHNIRMGSNCLLVGDFMTAGSVTIGNNNVFGGRSTVTDHVVLGDNMQFAGLAVVTKDVDEPGGAFGGHPLQPVGDYLKSCASIPHLPSIRKNLTRVMRKLGMT